MAVRDGANDIEMLKLASLGVALANGCTVCQQRHLAFVELHDIPIINLHAICKLDIGNICLNLCDVA